MGSALSCLPSLFLDLALSSRCGTRISSLIRAVVTSTLLFPSLAPRERLCKLQDYLCCPWLTPRWSLSTLQAQRWESHNLSWRHLFRSLSPNWCISTLRAFHRAFYSSQSLLIAAPLIHIVRQPTCSHLSWPVQIPLQLRRHRWIWSYRRPHGASFWSKNALLLADLGLLSI